MRLSRHKPIAAPDFEGPRPVHDNGSSPRVLVEEDDPATRQAMVNTLRAAGFDTVGCGGPDDADGRSCPLVQGDGCPAAEDADVILFSFRLADQHNRMILKQIRRANPRTPIVVEIPQPHAARHQDVLVGTTLLHSPVTRKTLTQAVLDAWHGPNRRQRVLRDSLPN